MNRHDLENELQGTQMILMAMLEELGGQFTVTPERLNSADSKYRLDAKEHPEGDLLFLVPKEN
jgi:hypothetical protein